ncbi:MBL fold metallo-hydrolase [Chloroflexota bacterium]
MPEALTGEGDPIELKEEANMIPITEVAKGIFKIGPLETGNERTPETCPHLIVGQKQALIWEPGEAGQVRELLEGIRILHVDRDSIAYLIVGHIHIHHCQGVPVLLKELPKATLRVHERAVPHMIDPTRLNESTIQVWGEGCPVISPVPADRVRAVADGEVIDLGGRELEFIYAPGHAPHQIAMFDHLTRALFPSDATGAFNIPNNERCSPDIRPPLFDVDKAVDTLHRLRALKPKVIFTFTRWGGVSHSPDDTLKWAEEDWRAVESICREGMKQKKTSREIGMQVTEYYKKVRIADEFGPTSEPRAVYGMYAYIHKQDPSLEMPKREESQPLTSVN